MRNYKDEGIIINIKQFKEADKFAVILGKKHGRIEAIAKSAGKIKSRKVGVMDLLNYAKFSFYKSKGIDLILEAELIDNFEKFKENIQDISEIFYLLEILDKFVISEDSNIFFSLLLDFLQLWESFDEQKDVLISAWELKILDAAGFSPNLLECIHCSDILAEGSERIAASSGEAGYLCSKHYDPSSQTSFVVEDKIIKVQKYLLGNELKESIALDIDLKLARRVRSIQKTWLEGIVENRLKSASFLEYVKNKG